MESSRNLHRRTSLSLQTQRTRKPLQKPRHDAVHSGILELLLAFDQQVDVGAAFTANVDCQPGRTA